ncbi:uncharacterized protein K02A2.6-like [Topomyia yanbarensis]|uniref:uncharacterized protein K02A2.6-like n=1 Tax=Topomyia yanbarensis TaxID=2498891 RepID=UPI00273CF0ED|nr:uncharacterized protein K02A2.6-like [Topomyia yanbarensis]
MPSDAEKWVKSCKTCAVNGKPEKPTPTERIFAPRTVWETIALDFNGPYLKFGGISILVIVDYRSRYLFAEPVKSTSFELTKGILEEIFQREGFPKSIKTDNGPPFNGEAYKNYCAERGINTVFSTPLFPQQNGLVENYMKVVNKAMATASANGTNFKVELQAAVSAHNASAHTVTKVPPEEIMLGRKIKRGLPLLFPAKANHDDELLNARDKKAKLQGKYLGDARRSAQNCRVKPGDTVIIELTSRTKGDSKFDTKRYTILEEKNGNLLLTDNEGRALRRHVSQTKKVCQWRDDEKTNNFAAEKQIRPTREHNIPSYLHNYVLIVEEEMAYHKSRTLNE